MCVVKRRIPAGTAGSPAFVPQVFSNPLFFLYHVPDNPQKSICQRPDLACAGLYHTSSVSQLISETSVTSQATFACHMAFRFSDFARIPPCTSSSLPSYQRCSMDILSHICQTLGYSHGQEEKEAVLLQNWLLLPEAMTSDILNSRYCLFFWSTLSKSMYNITDSNRERSPR